MPADPVTACHSTARGYTHRPAAARLTLPRCASATLQRGLTSVRQGKALRMMGTCTNGAQSATPLLLTCSIIASPDAATPAAHAAAPRPAHCWPAPRLKWVRARLGRGQLARSRQPARSAVMRAARCSVHGIKWGRAGRCGGAAAPAAATLPGWRCWGCPHPAAPASASSA